MPTDQCPLTTAYSLAGLAYTTVFTLVTLFLGVIIFNRTEQTFMDTV